ncbi:MAG: MatE family transporter [Phycisphaerales bacterium]|nr:MatE family transporter [Phycisphaerales bacterium]
MLAISSPPSSENVSPLRELLTLAAPTVAQMASYTVMQFIDAWVLSHLGTEAPTAVGNAGFIGFSIISFGMGVMFVVNAMASQEYGRKRFKRCGRWMWQGVWFAMLFSILALVMIPLAGPMFHSFGHTTALADMEATYLKIFLLTPVFKLVGVAAGQFLLATNRPATSLSAAVAGVGANALVAVPFILGGFGLKGSGVVGAAWAQNVGSIVEGTVLILYAFNATSRNRYGSLNWRFRPQSFARLLRIGLGTGVQITAEVSAWSLFMVYVVAHLGETANAANQFMFRYMAISFMPAFGISQAVTALVGRSVGEGRPDLAFRRAGLGYRVSTVYMICCGVGFAVFRYPLMQFFTADPAVQDIGATLLLFAAVYQLFDAMNVIYNGALRGVGDTFVPAMVTAGTCWGINVAGGTYIVLHWPQWGVAGPWTACTTYGLIVAVFAMCRFRFGPWRRKLAANDSKQNQSDRNMPVPAAAAGLCTASEA